MVMRLPFLRRTDHILGFSVIRADYDRHRRWREIAYIASNRLAKLPRAAVRYTAPINQRHDISLLFDGFKLTLIGAPFAIDAIIKAFQGLAAGFRILTHHTFSRNPNGAACYFEDVLKAVIGEAINHTVKKLGSEVACKLNVSHY